MKSFISPNFTSEKLDSPTYKDLVDVFEDRMRNWFLLPAAKLLRLPHGQIASVALLISYFEGIETYLTGKDSDNSSKAFFRSGFSKVFTIQGVSGELSTKIADAIYKQARCGFAHDGIFRNRVYFSGAHAKPILVTWPKKDGLIDSSGHVESIVINPARFYESIRVHFDGYIRRLREESDSALKQAFLSTVELKWAMNERDRVIGMSEDEFRGV